MVFDLYESADVLREELHHVVNETNVPIRSLAQTKFETDHPEVTELYPHLHRNPYEEMKIHLHFDKIDDIMNAKKQPRA
jgi:hypothetical protein